MTIRVENTACDSVTCAAIDVVGLPKGQPPGLRDGPWFLLLGTMRTRSACFVFPISETLTFQDAQGIVEHWLWRPTDSLAIGEFLESEGYSHTVERTRMIEVDRAPGWTVTLPSGADLTQGEACTPGS